MCHLVPYRLQLSKRDTQNILVAKSTLENISPIVISFDDFSYIWEVDIVKWVMWNEVSPSSSSFFSLTFPI